MKKVLNLTLALVGIASWMSIVVMLVKYSSCPTVGWVIFTAPIAVIAILLGAAIRDIRREEADLRRAIENYPNAKGNETATHCTTATTAIA